MMLSGRRNFIKKAIALVLAAQWPGVARLTARASRLKTVTVNGEIPSSKMGFALTHEHILVDFSGADKYDPTSWDIKEVSEVVLPYLEEIHRAGCRTFIDCTPAYIGRDVRLLQNLSDLSGLNILTNTGYYGAAQNKYLPTHAYSETSEKLAERWILEFENGIDQTSIRPGFIKIGVGEGSLSKLHVKIVQAAAITHNRTGLTIASHTGPSLPAFEQIEILRSNHISPEAFIWVHAQNEESDEKRIEVAKMGAWVSLDGLNNDNLSDYIAWMSLFKENKVLSKVLISHDAGWYSPGEDKGGSFRPFTTVFDQLIPALRIKGFTESEIQTVFVENPADAFAIRVRSL